MTERCQRYGKRRDHKANIVHKQGVHFREIGNVTAQNPSEGVGNTDDRNQERGFAFLNSL